MKAHEVDLLFIIIIIIIILFIFIIIYIFYSNQPNTKVNKMIFLITTVMLLFTYSFSS